MSDLIWWLATKTTHPGHCVPGPSCATLTFRLLKNGLPCSIRKWNRNYHPIIRTLKSPCYRMATLSSGIH